MFGRIRRNPTEKRLSLPWWNLAGAPGFISSAAYGSGQFNEALRNAASWACIDVLADALARTPFDAYRATGGDKRPVNPQPPVLVRPSGIVLRDVWRYQLAGSLLTDGNAFGEIRQWDGARRPVQIELVDPTTVTERKVEGGVPQCRYDGEIHQLYPHGDVWHVPGRMVLAGSPFALSPTAHAAGAVCTSLAAEDFSRQFFIDGAHPSAIIYANSTLTFEQAQDIKSAFRQLANSREPAVFGSDLRYEQVQTTPADSQFLDLMRWEVEQVCRFWRVPPGMVYASVSGQNLTYANVTDEDLKYLKHSLDGYFVRLEEAYTDILAGPQYVKAARDAILRATPESRHQIYKLRLESKTMTVNEVRRLEDEPPFADPIYDEPGIPGGAPVPAVASGAPMPALMPAGTNGSKG